MISSRLKYSSVLPNWKGCISCWQIHSGGSVFQESYFYFRRTN